jgi:predicted secreted protein
MTSPTSRSLKYLRDTGWTCAIVEHFNPHMKIRQDLFGFADVLAMQPGCRPLLVQVTSSGWASRVTKITTDEKVSPVARLALQSGFEIYVHGWRKLKSNRGRWTIKEIRITLDHF